MKTRAAFLVGPLLLAPLAAALPAQVYPSKAALPIPPSRPAGESTAERVLTPAETAAAVAADAVRDPFSPTEEMFREAERPSVEQLQQRVDQLAQEVRAHTQAVTDQQKLILDQFAAQRQLIEQIETRLDDLSTRLTTIPPITLVASMAGTVEKGAAWLDVGGTRYLARVGDIITVQPTERGGVLLSIFVKEIGPGGVVLEVGPWRERVVVR